MSSFTDVNCPKCNKKVASRSTSASAGTHSGYSCSGCKIRFDATFTNSGSYTVKNIRPM